ncbi:MAG: aldolase/citrate lyase family protein [Bauldia sp.]
MAAPDLAQRLGAGETLISSWNIWPEPLLAEIAARSGFDCVTLDMQHGLHDPVSVMRGIGAVALAGKPAVVRVPVGDNAMVSRALDMGAAAVIAPMINTAEEARAFAAAAKYPPVGERSWGPQRALTLQGIDAPTQLRVANRATLTLAMVETKRALSALDDILAVDGIDGIFVGPSDLSVTLTDGGAIAPGDPAIDAPIRLIGERTLKVGKIAGAFAWGGARLRFFRDIGYRFIALGTDQAYLTAGIEAMLRGSDAEIQR